MLTACFEKEPLLQYPRWPLSSLQTAGDGICEQQAQCLFTGGTEASTLSVATVWTCPYPQCREANHNSSLTSSTVCYFSRPPPSKGHNNKSLIPRPDNSTGLLTSLSFSTKWQNSRGAEEKTAPKTHELMETGTPSTIKSLLHISGPPLNFHSSCSETIFPLLQFPGNLDIQTEASNLRKTAADWDKNNYSSISLPRDTLSTSSSS